MHHAKKEDCVFCQNAQVLKIVNLEIHRGVRPSFYFGNRRRILTIDSGRGKDDLCAVLDVALDCIGESDGIIADINRSFRGFQILPIRVQSRIIERADPSVCGTEHQNVSNDRPDTHRNVLPIVPFVLPPFAVLRLPFGTRIRNEYLSVYGKVVFPFPDHADSLRQIYVL